MDSPAVQYSCRLLLQAVHLIKLPLQFAYLMEDLAAGETRRSGRLTHFCALDGSFAFVPDRAWKWLRRTSLKLGKDIEIATECSLGDIGVVYLDGFIGLARGVRVAFDGLYHSLAYLVDYGFIIKVSNLSFHKLKETSKLLQKPPLAIRFMMPSVDESTILMSHLKGVIPGRGLLSLEMPYLGSAADIQTGNFYLFVSTKCLGDQDHRHGEYLPISLDACLERNFPAINFSEPALTDNEQGDLAYSSDDEDDNRESEVDDVEDCGVSYEVNGLNPAPLDPAHPAMNTHVLREMPEGPSVFFAPASSHV